MNAKSSTQDLDRQTGTIESGRFEPGSVEPGSVEPGSVEPGSIESGSIESGSIESGSIESGSLNQDRIRRFTFKQDLEKIDGKTRDAINQYSNQGREALTGRLAELDREWPVDRALITGAGFFVWLGLILGTNVNRRLYRISAVAGGFILLFAFLGWAPPVLILRRLGVRTRGEINQERIALKVLRGDFDKISEGEPNQETRINRAMQAAS